MTVSDWHAAAVELRAAGLEALADLYAENARLVRDGQPPIWPVPDHLKASAHIAGKVLAEPEAFVGDSRELP